MKFYIMIILLLLPPVVNSNNRGLFNSRKIVEKVDEFEPKNNIFSRGVDRKTGLVIKDIKKYAPRDPAYRIIYSKNGLVKRRLTIKDNISITHKIINLFSWNKNDNTEEDKKLKTNSDTDSPR